jgi:hypothetical protein
VTFCRIIRQVGIRTAHSSRFRKETTWLKRSDSSAWSNVSVQISRLDGPWKQMLENDTLFKSIPEHLTAISVTL